MKKSTKKTIDGLLESQNDDFWGQVKATKSNDEIQYVDFHMPLNSFLEEREKVENLLQSLEQLRAELLQQLCMYEYTLSQQDLEAIGLDNDQYISFEMVTQDILRINMNSILPHFKKTRENKKAYYDALRSSYVDLFNRAFKNFKDKPSFKIAFVLIAQYFPNNDMRDLDNRFHSFVFNFLRNNHITPDDRWQYLSYMEKGFLDKENPRTEIYVCEEKNMFKVLRLLDLDIGENE